MAAKPSYRDSPVWRITVDEKMSTQLFRVLICGLADGVRDFGDRLEDWGPEQEVWIRPRTYARLLGLPDQPELRNRHSWETLSEGQVFLSGAFEVLGDRGAPTGFRVSPGRREFLRLDQVKAFRERLKRQYSDALRGRS